jgi:hypothetical protein
LFVHRQRHELDPGDSHRAGGAPIEGVDGFHGPMFAREAPRPRVTNAAGTC